VAGFIWGFAIAAYVERRKAKEENNKKIHVMQNSRVRSHVFFSSKKTGRKGDWIELK